MDYRNLVWRSVSNELSMFNDNGKLIKKFHTDDLFLILEPERVMTFEESCKFVYTGKSNPIIIMDQNGLIGAVRNDFLIWCCTTPANHRWNGFEYVPNFKK